MSKKVLNLALITALAPQGEEFTAEAVNEGVWLTQAHLEALEGKLAADAAAATKAADDITAAGAAKKTADDALTSASQTIAAHAARISELEAENATLKKAPAADLKTTSAAADAPPIDNPAATKSKYHTVYDDMAAQYK